MVTLPDLKVKTPIEAYRKAWDLLAITGAGSDFARYLDKVKFTRYDSGNFTFEAPTQRIIDLFARHSESCQIRKALALYVPDGIMVTVTVLLAPSANAPVADWLSSIITDSAAAS